MGVDGERLRINRKEFLAALDRDEDGHDALRETPYLDTGSGQVRWLHNTEPNGDLPPDYRAIPKKRKDGAMPTENSSRNGADADDELVRTVARFFYENNIEPEWF